MKKTTKAKPKWRKVRCLVEASLPSTVSERDLRNYVQSAIDSNPSVGGYYKSASGYSRLWAKQFSATISRMDGARPKKLQAAARAADALASRLRKM